MPYTPPSQLSPAASQPTSPAPSRSTSYLSPPSKPEPPSTGRPHLPRSSASSSYLNKHRRSPSAQSNEPDRPSESYKSVNHNAHYQNKTLDPYGSLRQSPPPANNSRIPTGMTISPPDSSHNSSDDEDVRGRTREIEKMEELKAAISIIQQRKAGSPDRNRNHFAGQSRSATDLTSQQIDGASSDASRLPLSREARKVSHGRSESDVPAPIVTHSPVTFRNDSEESDDSDGPISRPPMVRKKSGELVRPALRPSSRRRPSSMPGTPTYSKAVHFDSHLEHVRHFLQVDRPLAVSAGSSPADPYESETEFPFGSEEKSQRPRSSTPEFDIKLANFPSESEERQTLPVRVERTFLSADNKSLIGTIAVQNIAFQKAVVTRFTLDYWKTVSEVVAEYNNDVRKTYDDGCDRFTFNIRLADQANLENKTMFFCVRYQVNGQEYWDNNAGYNYQVDFLKKTKPLSPPKNTMLPTLGARPLSALPRARQSPSLSVAPRPKPLNASFDDFSSGFDNFESFVSSADALIGEPKIKLKSPRSRAELVADAPAMRRSKSSVQAFGTRYDFASSLNAAKDKAWIALGKESGLPSGPDAKQSSHEVPAFAASKSASLAPPKLENGVSQPAERTIAAGPNSAISKPAALVSEKPALTSQSYQELVDKYCFFGTEKATEPLTTHALSMVDGALDDISSGEQSISGGRSTGSSTPVARGISPTPPSSRGLLSLQISRSSSPLPRTASCSSTRSQSPVAFGYPYHQSVNNDLLAGHTAPAIRG